MDYEKEYKSALELASTSRHREAKEKLADLLDSQPDNVKALILLGKVEYYLRLFSSSSERFETALTYEPGNMAAYFGLEFFRERRKKTAFIYALISSLVLLIFLGAVFYFSLHSSVKLGFNRIENIFPQQIDELKAAVEKSTAAQLEREEAILSGIQELREQLEHYSNYLETLQEETQDGVGVLSERILELAAAQEKLEINVLSISETLTREMELLKALLDAVFKK